MSALVFTCVSYNFKSTVFKSKFAIIMNVMQLSALAVFRVGYVGLDSIYTHHKNVASRNNKLKSV